MPSLNSVVLNGSGAGLHLPLTKVEADVRETLDGLLRRNIRLSRSGINVGTIYWATVVGDDTISSTEVTDPWNRMGTSKLLTKSQP